ncbi:MAG: class I tRNA ligase family protein [Firmicutes bacterium]|nr:class I tRNA ligase family protein [Bacillota bacterium]
MDKNFDFKRAEAEINKRWLDNEMFRARINPDKQPFTIVMPPPNVTSKLHLGHGFELTILDAIIRFKRMQGFEALLVPGADHAAIATEVKVIEELKRQGIEKKDLTREQFLTYVEKWYVEKQEEIKNQIKRLGVSADWSRFAFTMDEPRKLAVRDAFKRLRRRGLIYKGERMINWCPQCKTALSDAEVEHTSKPQTLYHIKFSDLVIATVRPEAILSAAAVAVHPRDKRYSKLVGQTVTIPIINIDIPVIADDCADMKFGTGAVQMTAHSGMSLEFCGRHNLKPVPVINKDGIMHGDRAGEFAGLTVAEARKAIAKKLKDDGFLIKEQKHTSNVSNCYRCHTDVEPFISEQWFVKMQDLAKRAIEERPEILPKKFEKIYLHWLQNIKDWCISRQLTSGHQIPIQGETDVLDTWFSSALWPFSVFDKLQDLAYFYPTNVLVCGYEILFFWVIRMVFSGQEHMERLPFDTVLLHGIVRDKNGVKMSKSLGNGIDPIDVIDEFGADALRFSLLYGTKLDRDPRYSIERATLARNFINKIWNATKWFKANEEKCKMSQEERARLEKLGVKFRGFAYAGVLQDRKDLTLADKWILTKLNSLIKSITKKFEKFDFGVACVELQNFFWHDVCDVYLEEVKKQGEGYEVFRFVLMKVLWMLHPIMPFVTEEILWLIGDKPEIAKAKWTFAYQGWPGVWPQANFPKEKKEFDALLEKEREARAKLDEQAGRGKKIEHLKKEIARGEGMLSNKNFVERAPKKLVDEERAKLEEHKKVLATLEG